MIGTKDSPLRVAIIGSGPSGFYAADHLQKQEKKGLFVQIDMFDRLPTPFGLVRGGVAPDHLKIKNVTKVYERIAQQANFKFFGNVEFGKDITLNDIKDHYHAVIYATGAQTDRNLDIPGEDLSGSHAATEFVAWYNGHPDFCNCEFDLTQESVAVIGIGNVAMDVARILARSQNELMESDIAEHAMAALHKSNVKNIHIFGRRGPAQAKFTNPEIKELAELEEADLIIAPEEIALDELSKASLQHADNTTIRNVEIMQELSALKPQGRKKKIFLHFLASPIELLGDGHVEQMKVVKNELQEDERGGLRPKETNQIDTYDVGLVFRSVGYRGVALSDVPFYDRWGTIPHDKGRVLTNQEGGEPVTGNYVVGWIKRGPSGVVGTNKPDSVETVNMLLEDVEANKLFEPSQHAIEALLKQRNVQFVTFQDWLILDELELKRGEEEGRPRVKITHIEEMLEAIQTAKATQ